MSKELRRRIFSALKQIKGDYTLDDIADILRNDSKKDLAKELDSMVTSKWITKTSKDGDFYFRVTRILDAPLKKTPKNKFAKFEVISKVEKRPVRYMNPFFDLMPLLNQDGRGTCTGFSGAYTAWFNQLKYITPTPLTLEEVAAIKRNQAINVLNQCTMLTDILPKYAPSAEGLYDESRALGHVTVPEGSYIDLVCQIYKIYGYNYEKDRQTAHTSFCAPTYFPLVKNDLEQTKTFLAKQASNHRADNYVQVDTWEGLKDAIYKYGAVITAVNIYENYASQGSIGLLPEPRGEVVGGHALCACGYDDDLDVVYVIMSWGPNWTKLSGYSKKYYETAGGQAFAPIVSRDVLDEIPTPPTPDPEKYRLYTLMCNKTCKMTVNEDVYTLSTAPAQVKVMLELNRVYTLTCEVLNPMRVRPPTKITKMLETKESGSALIAFSFRNTVPR